MFVRVVVVHKGSSIHHISRRIEVSYSSCCLAELHKEVLEECGKGGAAEYEQALESVRQDIEHNTK